MEYFTVTAEIMAAASDYLPTAQKTQFIDRNSEKCFTSVSVRAGNREMPTMHIEDAGKKARYLMTALVRDYLHLAPQTEDGDDDLMTEAEYDRYAGSHLLNQFERLKSDAERRNKCFDLLQDYRDLEKRMNIAVYGLTAIVNDPVTRLSASMEGNYTPDDLQELMAQLKDAETSLKRFKEGQADGG